jgi:cell division cycle protein 37
LDGAGGHLTHSPCFPNLDPLPQTSASGSKAPVAAAAAVDPDDEELPDASPLALKFTTIPYLNFAQAFSFVQSNPSILVEQTTDSLLLEAFNAEIAGEKDRARRCVEKGLLVQYCRKLGKDGVRLFFQRCVPASGSPSFDDEKSRTDGTLRSLLPPPAPLSPA